MEWTLSMEFSWQEHWGGLPFATPGDLPDPGTEPLALASPTLAGRFFTTSTTWETKKPLELFPTVHPRRLRMEKTRILTLDS